MLANVACTTDGQDIVEPAFSLPTKEIHWIMSFKERDFLQKRHWHLNKCYFMKQQGISNCPYAENHACKVYTKLLW